MPKFENRKPKKEPGEGVQPYVPHQIVQYRCKVCNHPLRNTVDLMLATGWSQAAVLRYLENAGMADHPMPSHNSMSLHARKHLSILDAGVRRIMEEKAKAIGLDTEAAANFILTKEAVAEAVVQRGLTSLIQGHTIVEPKDVLAALATLEKLESTRSEAAVDELMREFHLFVKSVKKFVSVDVWEQIAEEFERSIESGHNLIGSPEAEVQDADVIDEEDAEDD